MKRCVALTMALSRADFKHAQNILMELRELKSTLAFRTRRFVEAKNGDPRISIYWIARDLKRIQDWVEDDPDIFTANQADVLTAIHWARDMIYSVDHYVLSKILEPHQVRAYLSSFAILARPDMLNHSETIVMANALLAKLGHEMLESLPPGPPSPPMSPDDSGASSPESEYSSDGSSSSSDD